MKNSPGATFRLTAGSHTGSPLNLTHSRLHSANPHSYTEHYTTLYRQREGESVQRALNALFMRERESRFACCKSFAIPAAHVEKSGKVNIRLTNVPFIAKAIEDVNKYFNNTSAVRVYRRMKNFVYASWQILTILAVVLLMGVQSLCSVYSCPELFNTLGSE